MTEPSDEDLLNQYFEGDANAGRQFIARHSGRVIAYSEAKGLRPEIAVEVAQEAFLKLHRFIHQYERGRPALAWFFTIVHRCVLDAYRVKDRKEVATTEDFFEDIPAVAEEASSDSDGSVDKLLGILSSEQQFLVRSRVFEGLSFKEIASATGKTETSLRKIYERARTALKQHLGEKRSKYEE